MLKKIIIALSILIFYLIFGTIFWGDHLYMIPSTLLTCFLFTYFLFKKNILTYKKELLLIFLPITFLFINIGIFNNNFGYILVYIIFIPVFSFLGYHFFKSKSKILLVTSILLIGFVDFYIQPNFFMYYNFSEAQKPKNELLPNIIFYDDQDNIVKIPKDKIVVLDFWTITCGVCFKKLPAVNELKKRFKDNKQVLVMAVNVPIKNYHTRSEAINIFKEQNLELKSLYTTSMKEVQTKLKFNKYPNIVVIKNNKIMYSGFIEPINRSYTINYFTVESKINELLK